MESVRIAETELTEEVPETLIGMSEVREAGYWMPGTAEKNRQAILHFYLDESGMDFWSARRFRRIGGPGQE